jgi:hypothetical protein
MIDAGEGMNAADHRFVVSLKVKDFYGMQDSLILE